MKVYVAGKITGLDREATLEKFERAREVLTALGHDVLIPTVLPVLDGLLHEDYLHICFAMIDVCDAVCMLPDWEQSTGAREERSYAQEWRKNIWYYSEIAGID